MDDTIGFLRDDYRRVTRKKIQRARDAACRPLIRKFFENKRGTPWRWPIALLSPEEQALFHEIFPKMHPLDMPMGDTLLVGVRDQRGILMRLTAPNGQGAHIAEHHEAHRLWEKARWHALRAAPCILNANTANRPLFVESLRDDRSLQLDGTSYHLAFCLHHLSVILQLSIPFDVIGLADINDNGKLIRVGGLDIKIPTILQNAPSVTRLLVAPAQLEHAQQILGNAGVAHEVTPISANTLQDVLNTIWEGQLEAAQQRRLSDPDVVTELIDEFYEQTFEGTDRYPSWAPIQETLNRTPDESISNKTQKIRRQYTLSVAYRHDGNSRKVREYLQNIEQIIESEPRPDYKERLRASFLQSIHDAGIKIPTRADQLGRDRFEQLTSGAVLRPGVLRTLGAWNRTLLRDGALTEVSKLSQHLLKQWYEYRHRSAKEASHPLSVLYHCAGLLHDPDVLACADDFRDRFRRFNEASHWTISARMKAQVLFNNPTAAHASLQNLSKLPNIPDWKWLSINRLTYRWLATQSDDFSYAETVSADGFIQEPKNQDQLIFGALVQLDHAIIRQDTEAMNAAYQTLTNTMEGPLFAYLKEHAPEEIPPYQWVADAYPS